MMMDCPRCGFSQPKDRFCANCGLNVEQYIAKPQPLWLRALQNPNLHLTLIGVLIAMLVFYIIYSHNAWVGREVVALFNGTPISSRDSAETEEAAAPEPLSPAPAAESTPSEIEPASFVEASEPKVEAEAPAAATPQKLEVAVFEVPREILSAYFQDAQNLGEAPEGRAFMWNQGAKVAEALRAGGRVIDRVRSLPLTAEGQLMIEAPEGSDGPLQFAVQVQLTKVEGGKDFAVKWESHLALPGETPGTPGPQSVYAASANLPSSGTLLIFIEPPARTLREDTLARGAEGPLTIFQSEEFRAGGSDLVLLVQPR